MIIFHQTQRSCDNISPVNQHLCDLGSFFVFLKVFCVFHLFLPFSQSRIMEAVLRIMMKVLTTFWCKFRSEIWRDDQMDHMHGSMQ